MANLTMMWMMIVLVVINHSSALLVPQHFVVNTSMSLIAAGRPSLDCDHGSLLCRLTGEDDLDLLVMPFANLQECRCTFPASLATASPGYYTVSLVTMNQEGAVNATLEASRVLVTSSPLQWSALASSSGGDGSPQPSATPAFYQGYGGKLRLVHLGDPFPKHACPVAPIAAKLQFLKGGALFWTANLSCSVELGDGRTQTIFSTEHLDYIPVGDALCPSNGSSCLIETMVSLGEGRWSPVGPLSVVPPMSIYRSRPRSITVPSDGDRFVVCVDARTSSGEAAAVPQLLLSTDGNFTIDAFINRSCFQGYFSLRPSNNTTTVLVGNGDAASLDEPSAMPNTHYGVSHHVSRFFSMLATPTTSSFVRMNGVDWIRISDDGSASTVYSGPLTDGTNPDCPDCKSNVVLIVAVVVPSVVVLVVVVCALWRCCRRETVHNPKKHRGRGGEFEEADVGDQSRRDDFTMLRQPSSTSDVWDYNTTLALDALPQPGDGGFMSHNATHGQQPNPLGEAGSLASQPRCDTRSRQLKSPGSPNNEASQSSALSSLARRVATANQTGNAAAPSNPLVAPREEISDDDL